MVNTRMCKFHVGFMLLGLVIVQWAGISEVNASDQVDDRFRLAIGGYAISKYESSMSLSDQDIGAGVSIVPETALGLDTKQTVFRLDGHYRLNAEHALTYSWYRITSNGSKTLEDEIDWVDDNGDPITIPIGANVTSTLDYDIFKIGYLWSYYHSNKVELLAGAGLHITRIRVGLSASTTSSGISAKNVSTTVPLPVLSVGLSYNVTPDLNWYLKSEFFAMSFDNWDGVYTDSTLGMEYRIWDNVGIGGGIGTNSLKLTENTDDSRFIYENRITGIMLYLAGYF